MVENYGRFLQTSTSLVFIREMNCEMIVCGGARNAYNHNNNNNNNIYQDKGLC